MALIICNTFVWLWRWLVAEEMTYTLQCHTKETSYAIVWIHNESIICVTSENKCWLEFTMCRNPESTYYILCCRGFLLVMATALHWWLLSVAGLRLWHWALILASYLLTSQQLTQSISALLNTFGSQDASEEHIILRRRELLTDSKGGTADKSGYLQRSSQDCFERRGREGFRTNTSEKVIEQDFY